MTTVWSDHEQPGWSTTTQAQSPFADLASDVAPASQRRAGPDEQGPASCGCGAAPAAQQWADEQWAGEQWGGEQWAPEQPAAMQWADERLSPPPDLAGRQHDSVPLAHESLEEAAVRQAVAGGAADPQALTDAVFNARHREREGSPLMPSERGFAALSQEWAGIRDEVVAPLVGRPATTGATGDLWVPGAERVKGPRSSGGTYVAGPWRFVFHTIEGEPSERAFRALAARHTNPPHLWAMPHKELLLQTVPLNRSAYALARPGRLHTNRQRAVQVELWGFAATMGSAPPEVLAWLAERLLAPVARLVPINLDRVRPQGIGVTCYGTRSPCRMSAQEWTTFDGVCGHKDVPDNKHWDPGRLDVAAIAARAKALLAGGGAGASAPTQRDHMLADHDGPAFEAELDEEPGYGHAHEGPFTGSPAGAATFEHSPQDQLEAESPWPEHLTMEQMGMEQLEPSSAALSPTTAPPLPPKPPLSGPVPVSRNCCLLDRKSIKGTDTRGSYAVATWPDSGKPGIVYSGKAGFLDLAHLFSVVDVTAFGYQQIYAAKGAAGTKVKTANGQATLTGAAPADQWIQLAGSIAYDDAFAYEIDTYLGSKWRAPGYRNSAFSPEDLCSNFLGTVVAERALRRATWATPTFTGNVETEMLLLFQQLDAQKEVESLKAFTTISSRWVDEVRLTGKFSYDYLRRRNFTRTPWTVGHPSDAPTPTWVTAPFTLTSGYVYRHRTGMTNAHFFAKVTEIRLDAQQRYGPRYDKPD